MNVLRQFAFLVGVTGIVGCGGGYGSTGPTPAEVPLTVAEWKEMPAEKKYQAESYERLKVGEPKFKDDRAWDQFYRTVVLPGQKKEKPTAK